MLGRLNTYVNLIYKKEISIIDALLIMLIKDR